MEPLAFLKDNKPLYNKHLMGYKNPDKWGRGGGQRAENKTNKEACKHWFKNQRTIYGKLTHTKSGQATSHSFKPTLCNISLQRLPSNLHAKLQFPGDPMLVHQKTPISLQSWRACQCQTCIKRGAKDIVRQLPHPIPNPPSTQSCSTPTINEAKFQLEAQEIKETYWKANWSRC